MDAEDARCNDEAMEPPFKFIAWDRETGEITHNDPMDEGALLLFFDQIERWKSGKPRRDPFEEAPDPRDVGI